MPKKKTLNQDLFGLTSGSMIISGGSMIARVPALNAPAGIKQAFPTAASFMPIASVATMSKHTLDMVKKIKPKKYWRR